MTIASVEGTEPIVSVDSRQRTNAIIASVLGWALDLFDLFILLYVAPVIGALFFPSSLPTENDVGPLPGLANFKRPRRIVFVDDIPKSPVGKLLRRLLVAGEYQLERTPPSNAA